MENYIWCGVCKKDLIYHGRNNPDRFDLCEHTKNGDKRVLVVEDVEKMPFYKWAQGGRNGRYQIFKM